MRWSTLYFAGRGAWARARLQARRPADPARLSIPPPGTAPLRLNCIVFSRDRPMQLDACLRSIERNAPYDGPITVVYRATDDRFEAGYRALAAGERVRLVREGDFRSDVLAALEPSVAATVFHTDDDVFFRAPPGAPFLLPGVAAFSLRLGENTTYCYPYGRPQTPPETGSDGPVIAWDWTRLAPDFGYPLALNGHVMETRLVRRIVERARFSNPNRLEDALHIRRYLAPPLMLAFRESCLVSIPANVVTTTHANRAAEDPELSTAALNERFLAGERIDFDRMDFSAVDAAHCELPLVFTQRL